jgi:hypothetical protein
MGLDRLHRDEQLLGDLLVGVAPRDEAQHLALALGEAVEVLVDRRGVGRREGVEDEAGQPGREDRVALLDPEDGVDEVVPVIVLVT